jgi:hypothetical protein
MSLRNLTAVIGVTLALAGVTAPSGQNISTPKLDLIKQAMASMKIDERIHGMVRQRTESRVESIRIENPGLSDSLAGEARAVIARVYESNLEGRNGLMPRVYAVLDRRLTEEDLKFAVNFRGSDQGKRYRELVPRVVNESLEAGRQWSESLEPEIRQRLEDTFRGQGVRL